MQPLESIKSQFIKYMYEYKYCGFSRRFFSIFADIGILILLLIGFVLIGITISIILDNLSINNVFLNIFSKIFYDIIFIRSPIGLGWAPVLSTLYFSVFLCLNRQATLGKYFFEMKVITPDGKKLNFLRSYSRTLLQFISFFTIIPMIISVLLIIFTKQKTALHDIICKTRVVACDKRQYCKI